MAKRIISDESQPCEILQFIKSVDVGLVSEHRAQIRHRISLGIAQFAVAVGVPIGHTNGFHVVVSENDIAIRDEIRNQSPVAGHQKRIRIFIGDLNPVL